MDTPISECTESRLEGCGYIIVCRKGLLDMLGREKLVKLRYMMPGQIVTGVDMENDLALYLYVNPGSMGGFYLEAPFISLNKHECSRKLRETLLQQVHEKLGDDPRITQVTMIIEEKMLR